MADCWQPIETAPKDGTYILAWRGHVVVVRWNDDRYAQKPAPFWDGTDDRRGKLFMRRNAPSHWMPLPEPPKASS